MHQLCSEVHNGDNLDIRSGYPKRCGIESPQQQLLSRKMTPLAYVLYRQDYESQSHVDQTHKPSWSTISLLMNETYSFAQYDRTCSPTYPNHCGIDSRLRILVDWRPVLSWHIDRIFHQHSSIGIDILMISLTPIVIPHSSLVKPGEGVVKFVHFQASTSLSRSSIRVR